MHPHTTSYRYTGIHSHIHIRTPHLLLALGSCSIAPHTACIIIVIFVIASVPRLLELKTADVSPHTPPPPDSSNCPSSFHINTELTLLMLPSDCRRCVATTGEGETAMTATRWPTPADGNCPLWPLILKMSFRKGGRQRRSCPRPRSSCQQREGPPSPDGSEAQGNRASSVQERLREHLLITKCSAPTGWQTR